MRVLFAVFSDADPDRVTVVDDEERTVNLLTAEEAVELANELLAIAARVQEVDEADAENYDINDVYDTASPTHGPR